MKHSTFACGPQSKFEYKLSPSTTAGPERLNWQLAVWRTAAGVRRARSTRAARLLRSRRAALHLHDVRLQQYCSLFAAFSVLVFLFFLLRFEAPISEIAP